MNIEVVSPTKIKLTSEAYITRMADRYVPDWRARAEVPMPSTDKLLKAYEVAHKHEQSPSPELVKSYGGKVGALVYTSPCVRVDACATIGRLSRALTFPTRELDSLCDDTIVYLAQTAHLGLTFDGHADHAGELMAESDSDWAGGPLNDRVVHVPGWCGCELGQQTPGLHHHVVNRSRDRGSIRVCGEDHPHSRAPE